MSYSDVSLSAFESVKGKIFPLMPCGERPTVMSEYFLSPKPVVLNAWESLWQWLISLLIAWLLWVSVFWNGVVLSGSGLL